MSARCHRARRAWLPPLLLAWCAGALAAAARAQETPARALPTPSALPSPLTLADAVARALDAAPPVAAARAAEASARARLADAEAELAPALALMGSATRYQKPTIVTPIHGFTPGLLPSFDRSVFQGDLQLRYDLWDGGGRGARIAQRQAELEAAQAGTSAVSSAAGSRAIAAYLMVRTLDEQLAAHDERLRALAAERDRVAKLLAVGRAAPVDQLRVRAAQASAEADRVAVAGERERAGRDLLRLLGEDPQETVLPPLAPAALREPQPPPRAELLAHALAGSADVERRQRELAAAEAAVRAARAGRAPALRLEGNVLGFAGGNGEREGEWNAGLQLALPLWDPHLAARVALAEAGRDAAAAAVRITEDDVGGALDRAWSDLATARARAASLAEAEARYEEVVRVERLRLTAGAGTEDDYLRAESDLLTARAAAVEARGRVATARAELARVSGELSAAWVAEAFAADGAEARPPVPEERQR